MSNSIEVEYSLDKKYARLEQMIGQASEMFEKLVRAQGQAMRVNYAKQTMFLCLVRQEDGKGLCCGVRWAKFRFRKNSEGKVWYNGWLPGRVPASTTKKIEPLGYQQFIEIDGLAKSITALRKNLTTKKKRVLGTIQSLKTEETQMSKIGDRLENFML